MKPVFWTTSEARDCCLRIFSKISGIHAKRNAHGVVCLGSDDPQTEIPIEDAEREYRKDSRFPLKFILPSCIFPTPSPTDPLPISSVSPQRSQNRILGFPGRRFRQTPSPKKLSHIHEHCLRILLILAPTPPHFVCGNGPPVRRNPAGNSDQGQPSLDGAHRAEHAVGR